ncbi:HAD-like domain-containing protein [Lipomyces tetrasporus]|uniref:RNA polymerase II subunit A C-terminal domain phosphatase n=1 Tax=Lipomyces tetrasporus TaxID=54092 RepID=A0AAD7QUF1_9ASCO|nr:HAD-like domain-containing protein [Lipomyces tetrasporus]KAJ8101493.1 HAD-like domain-containing protein [Lipomyces tetrasporus]
MTDTDITLPWTLRYPITIVQLLVAPGTEIRKNTPLFTYRYKTTITQTRGLNEEVEVPAELLAVFESPVEGTVGKWTVQEGDVVEKAGQAVLTITEACTHAIQFAGMCALCGKDLTYQDYSGYQESERANIKMFHNTTGLAVSMEEAERIEKSSTMALLAARKLILVVDLDQTVIHTTVDPLIGEWKKDPTDPHYPAVKDVYSFSLQDAGNPRGYWYYVKVRPGLPDFLERISHIYELHIYTMATKSYAAAISKIIDPDGKYFGDRVLTRDESGNLEQKNLQRLFPVDTSLVTIIDDRGDVWKWSSNLIKVIPYEFFVGIGDINSGFLPKAQDVKATGSTSGGTLTVTADADTDTLSESGDPSGADNDKELDSLEPVLVRVHTEYYKAYDEVKAKEKPVNKRKRTRSDHWREGLPDIKVIMPEMKMNVLNGTVILFSGTIPLGANIDTVDVVIWARSFGATIVKEFSTDITHLVAERVGTKKVQQAARHSYIKIVSPAWLYKCLSAWTKVPENDYILEVPENNAFDAEIDGDMANDRNTHDDVDADRGSSDGSEDSDFSFDEEPVVRSLLVNPPVLTDDVPVA